MVTIGGSLKDFLSWPYH